MISFFILDQNLLSKQKIENILKKKKMDEIIVRNRGFEGEKKSPFNFNKKPYVQPNVQNLLSIDVKGLHFSLFYNKLISTNALKGVKTIKKTASAHNLQEIVKVFKLFKPNFIFISPIFPTETHLHAKTLGIIKLFSLINKAQYKNFIILGGISKTKANRIKKLDFHNKIKGFAGIRGF